MYGNPMQQMNPITAQGQQRPQPGMQAPQALPQILQSYGLPQLLQNYGILQAPQPAPPQPGPVTPQQPIAAPAQGQPGQPVVQPRPFGGVQGFGGFNPFFGFMRNGPAGGGYGPRFGDLFQRAQSAVNDSMGLFARWGQQNAPTTAPASPAPRPAPPQPAPPPQGPQFAPPPQMPQQYAGQPLQTQFAPQVPAQPPMAGARPYAQGGRVSSLACRCGGGV